MKKFFSIILSIIMIFSFSACNEEKTEKYCSNCDESFSEEEKFCSKCGDFLETNTSDATDTEKLDKDMSKTDSESHTHLFSEATCISPATCFCGETLGEVAEHQYGKDGICVGCLAQSVTITMPSFPKKVSQIWYGEKEKTIEITNITYEISCYDDNDNSIHFIIHGKKVFDIDASIDTLIPFKIYDSDGAVIHIGDFSVPALSVGESFKLRCAYTDEVLNKLPSGKYKLELMDNTN